MYMHPEAFLFAVSVQFSRSVVSNSATPWTTARQASLSITSSRSPPKPMSIVSVTPSNHLILFRPLLLLPSIFLSIRVFSNESALHIRWPKYWNFSFNICPSNEHPELISSVVSSAAISARGCHTVTAEWQTQRAEIVSAPVHLLIYHRFNQALPYWKTLPRMTPYSQFKTDLN